MKLYVDCWKCRLVFQAAPLILPFLPCPFCGAQVPALPEFVAWCE